MCVRYTLPLMKTLKEGQHIVCATYIPSGLPNTMEYASLDSDEILEVKTRILALKNDFENMCLNLLKGKHDNIMYECRIGVETKPPYFWIGAVTREQHVEYLTEEFSKILRKAWLES